ncbi:MAG TPA: hypothetical protein VN426_17600 [Syntrophomonadaceae bacterium]|nr:hypothetical protein [Syntrophomonadaceae bacterium]
MKIIYSAEEPSPCGVKQTGMRKEKPGNHCPGFKNIFAYGNGI